MDRKIKIKKEKKETKKYEHIFDRSTQTLKRAEDILERAQKIIAGLKKKQIGRKD